MSLNDFLNIPKENIKTTDKLDKSELSRMKSGSKLAVKITLPLWLASVIAVIATGFTVAGFALFICIGICMLFTLIFLIALYGFISVGNISRREERIINNGRIVDGRIIRFCDEGVGSNAFMSSTQAEYGRRLQKHNEFMRNNPTANWKQARSAIYEYEDESGKTIQRKSPAYLSDRDKILIMRNDFKVQIAVHGKKSCIYNI